VLIAHEEIEGLMPAMTMNFDVPDKALLDRLERGQSIDFVVEFTGKAYRVPIRTGSIAELNLITERPVTVEEVNHAFRKAAATAPLTGVLGVLEEEWASSRILGDPRSSIVDLPLTAVQEGAMLSVATWYDNELGYATRLAETAAWIAR